MNQSRASKQNGTCKICRKRVHDLKRGHVVPEWCYKVSGLTSAISSYALYNSSNNKDRYSEVSPAVEYFFCGQCEEFLGQGEDQIRRIFLSPNNQRSNTNAIITAQEFPHLSIETDKKHIIGRALLGIIFKAHLSNNPFCKDVFLSKNVFNKIQNIINPDNTNFSMPFSFMVFKFFNLNEGVSYAYDMFQINSFENPMSLIAVEGRGGKY